MSEIMDGIECQRSSYTCQGVFHCDQLDPVLLAGYERYEPDIDDRKELWEAEQAVNMREGSTVHALVAAYVFSCSFMPVFTDQMSYSFYNKVQSMRCKRENDDGHRCNGVPSLRKLNQRNLDGQIYWLGCSGYFLAKGEGHLMIPIPPNIDEVLFSQLFKNKGQFSSDDDSTNTGLGVVTLAIVLL